MEKLYFGYLKSELGFWGFYAHDQGLKSIVYSERKFENESILNPIIEEGIRQLKSYFDGELQQFDLPLDMVDYTDFQQSVWRKLEEIPYGKTINYTQLSYQMNHPKAIRAIASANGKNPFTIVIPCHRVIGKDGSMTGYASGIPLKEKLLRHENALRGEQMQLF